jgi:type III secretion system low calcium response chaperone LcrH/SycD
VTKDLSEFRFSSEIKQQIKDRAALKKELILGKTPQELAHFSHATMAKFYQAAYQLFEQKKYKEAADAFLFLATFNPHFHDYWLGLGMATQLLHDYEGAIDAYELAALCDMTNPTPYFYLAKCLFAIHDRESAMQALDLAIETASQDEAYEELRQQAEHARDILLRDENLSE